jgi:hypothetical protein
MRGAVASALLFLASACGEGDTVQIPPLQHMEALSPAGQAIKDRIEQLEASGLAEELLTSVGTMLEAEPVPHWIDMDGWSLGRNELLFVQKMNSRDWQRDTDRVRALDFECEGHPLHVISRYKKELAEHGIDLLVVPVPNRAQVYFDRLPNVSSDGTFLGGDLAMPRLLLEMSSIGIDVIDLYPAFAKARVDARSNGEEAHLFLDYNPHWSPTGVRIASMVIAERIRSLDWFKPGKAREGEHFFVNQQRLHLENPQFGNAPSTPPEELHYCVQDADGKRAHRRNRKSPVLVLADSYGSVYINHGSDICSHISAQLGYPIDFICIQQGAENSVWQAVARRKNGLAGKKVVIWLFSRDLLLSREMRKVDIFLD